MSSGKQLCIKLIHCGNVNVANQVDNGQKNIFYMPMGLLALAGALDKEGFDVQVLHMDIESNMEYGGNFSEILDIEAVDVIGFDCHWVNQSLVVLETAEYIKKLKPQVFIFLGGFTASLFSEEIVENYQQIDAVIRGDGEIPIVELCNSLYGKKSGKAGAKCLGEVQNLVWKNGDGAVIVNSFSYVGGGKEMESLDFSALRLMKNWEQYRDLSKFWTVFEEVKSQPLFLLEVGRGCTYACTFCGGNCEAQKRMNNRTGYAIRTCESVLSTLKSAYSLGYRLFYTCFEYEGSTEWYISLFKSIKEEGLNISFGYGCWRIPSKPLVDALSQCFEHVIFEISPETSDMALRRRNKDIRLYYSNAELEECLDYISTKDNIKVQLYFGYFVAGDNESTVLATLEYILKLILKYRGFLEIEYGNFSTDPGSLLFFHPEKYDIDIKVRNFEDYIANIRETYVEQKEQSADMTLFKPRGMSAEAAADIDRKVKLFNYLFRIFRASISLMVGKTGKLDIVMDIIRDSDLQPLQGLRFYPEELRDVLFEVCKRYRILDRRLIEAIDSEYDNQKNPLNAAKPATQVSLDMAGEAAGSGGLPGADENIIDKYDAGFDF